MLIDASLGQQLVEEGEKNNNLFLLLILFELASIWHVSFLVLDVNLLHVQAIN